MAATYVLSQDAESRYVFTLRAHGGQVLLTSPGYPDKDTALRCISAARTFSGRGGCYETRTAENGQPYFVLKNGRQEVLGQSEAFPDAESLQKGINTVKGTRHGARLEDQTIPPKPARSRRA